MQMYREQLNRIELLIESLDTQRDSLIKEVAEQLQYAKKVDIPINNMPEIQDEILRYVSAQPMGITTLSKLTGVPENILFIIVSKMGRKITLNDKMEWQLLR